MPPSSRLCSLGEAWRLFPEFADECVYLDIETTGLSTVFDSVTMIGMYDGRDYKVFIEGENLQDFAAELERYSVLVTFNGSGFDLRFLKLAFPELRIPPIHIDLRWLTRKLGLCGGLKEIETQLGITRPDEVKDLGGYSEATVLWSKYLRGERFALQQLVQYNTEDVVHLKAIMQIAYDRLSRRTATFLRNSIAPIFSGVSEMPRAARSVVRRAKCTSKSSGVVASLLAKCGHQRVVGIDLTGSERRATGWALMNGAEASTMALSTDEELIRETVAATRISCRLIRHCLYRNK